MLLKVAHGCKDRVTRAGTPNRPPNKAPAWGVRSYAKWLDLIYIASRASAGSPPRRWRRAAAPCWTAYLARNPSAGLTLAPTIPPGSAASRPACCCRYATDRKVSRSAPAGCRFRRTDWIPAASPNWRNPLRFRIEVSIFTARWIARQLSNLGRIGKGFGNVPSTIRQFIIEFQLVTLDSAGARPIWPSP